MSRLIPFAALGGSLLLGGCAVPAPPGPTVMAWPGAGKSFDQFQRDDAGCRQFAAQRTGYASPGAAANQAGIGSAILGTGIGAAAGALLGAAGGHAGAGAAIGAGSGLLFGSAVGANNAAASGFMVQRAYNMAYMQCMYANGNRVPGAPPPGGPPAYPYAYAPYPPGPFYGY